MFQISDLYWCSPPGQGTGCGLNCAELEDNDITDDVKCMLKIFEEHRYLSNDGFTAWTVYKPQCHGRADSYIDGCFKDDENSISNVRPGIVQPLQTRKPTTVPYWQVTTTQEPTVTDKLFDTTLIETTTMPSWKSSSFSSYDYAKQLSTLRPLKQLPVTTNKINSQSAEKFFKLHLNPYQTSKLNNEVAAKKTENINKPFTKSPKNIFIKSSSTTRQYRPQSIFTTTTAKPKINFSKAILQSQAKATTTTKTTKNTTPATTTLRAYKSIRSQTKPTQKTSTPAFNVFAFFLNDYTSKRPPIVYKPIQFGENSLKIFTRKSDEDLQTETGGNVATESLALDKSKLIGKNAATTTQKPLSFFNYYPLPQQNRIGRAGNITPHSIEYLLKLTTPRTRYG
jgi:C-type lysozyme/alpha-lactalbumin family